MNQLLEKSLESNLIPNTLKRDSLKKLYDDPSALAKKLAENSLKNFNINKKQSNKV